MRIKSQWVKIPVTPDYKHKYSYNHTTGDIRNDDTNEILNGEQAFGVFITLVLDKIIIFYTNEEGAEKWRFRDM